MSRQKFFTKPEALKHLGHYRCADAPDLVFFSTGANSVTPPPYRLYRFQSRHPAVARPFQISEVLPGDYEQSTFELLDEGTHTPPALEKQFSEPKRHDDGDITTVTETALQRRPTCRC